MAYESFVGRRYLMAKQRSRVVSIITLIAVGGVGLGVTALIVVLSVMGGFTQDLTEKILGARAHVVIQAPDYSPIPDATSVADEALEFDGVVGASPFLETEVMVSSPTNLSGVILRGIDIDRVGDVSDLPEQIEEGKIAYLDDDRELDAFLEEEQGREVDELLRKLDGDRDRRPGRRTLDDEGDSAPPELPDLDIIDEDNGESPPELPELDSVDDETNSPPELPQLDDSNPPADNPGSGDGVPGLFDDEVASADLPELPSVDDEDGDLPALPPIDDDAGTPPPVGTDGGRHGRVPGLIIGTELANSLQVGLGDEINVVTPRGEMGPTGPIPRSRPFRVVGVFYTGMYEYDANHAYTNLPDAARLLDFDGATGVEIRVADVDDSVSIADQIRDQMGADLDVLDWQELNSSLFFALRLERIAMFVVLTFIILVASFSIVAMLIMIVIEKAREIAIMKSMGATNGGIMRIFIYQGVVIGISGALLGLVAGLAICHYLATVGMPLDSEVYYIATLPVEVNTQEVIAVVVCAVVISFLATLYPSYQAARLNPVEGLRYD